MVFQTHRSTIEQLEATQKCLSQVPSKLFEGQRRVSSLGLSHNELSTTLHKKVNDKAPSLDGFPCEFCKATWEFF